jgi:general secretion pathway protein C
MVSNSYSRWAVAVTTFVVWALVAGSAVYWGLKLTARPEGPAAATVAARAPAAMNPMSVARLLGASATSSAAPAVASLGSRFSLVGVVASSTHHGAALISVDGKPAKPFRVGAAVDEGLILQSVDRRHAVLAASAEGQSALTLEVPPIRH